MNGNTVTVVGNITDNPELRFTAGGQAMARFTVAVNRRWQDRTNNEWQEETSFFDCTCWREQAENAAESLKKGTRVLVNGRLRQRRWETPEGDKRSAIGIEVDEIGPSLRWATASIERNARKGDDFGGSGGGSGGGSPEPARAGAGWDSPPDEEPF